MAGVNMRLEAGALRELHWHKTAEWAYIISVRSTIHAYPCAGLTSLAGLHSNHVLEFGRPELPHHSCEFGNVSMT